MAEIGQQIKAPPGAAAQQGQQQPTPQSRPQVASQSPATPGVVVNVNNIQGAEGAPKKVLIDKNSLEQFLQRHPEVLQAMAQEMQQAATAGEIVPRTIPVNQPGQQISNYSQGTAAPQANAAIQVAQPPPVQQSSMQRLVTMPASTPPSSPYGIGEMNQASRVDITSLDTQAELYQTDFTIQPVAKSLRGYKKASGAYAHQASIEPIRYAEDEERKNNPESQRRLESAAEIKSALKDALSSAQAVEAVPATEGGGGIAPLTTRIVAAPETAPAPRQQSASALTQPAPEVEDVERRKAEILPFALQYARSLGYSPEQGESQKILQDTVNFYSKSDKLANTLKNLVNVLPPG